MCDCVWNGKQMKKRKKKRKKEVNNQKQNKKKGLSIVCDQWPGVFRLCVVVGDYIILLFVSLSCCALEIEMKKFWQTHMYWSSMVCLEFELVSGLELKMEMIQFEKSSGIDCDMRCCVRCTPNEWPYAICMLDIDLWPMGESWKYTYIVHL